MIIAGIDIDVDASDNVGGSGMDRVEFYIDGSLMHTANSPPYVWTWDEKAFFKNTIKVIAYDEDGLTDTDAVGVFIINFDRK